MKSLYLLLFSLILPLVGCSETIASRTVIRNVDDIQVMTPEEVAKLKAENKAATSDSGTGANPNSENTVPLNQDNRPAQVKLFAAYQEFNKCIQDDGYKIEGNLQDPNNPALKDPDYVASLTKCAARSDIINVLRATQEEQAKMTPDQVENQNKNFKLIADCLEKRDWTIETSVNDIGLIQPKVFLSPDGTINERDLNQCITETGINVNG